MMENVRVRFAPSPTGPLHIGGVRTALFNYLFARKLGGKMILRIEDTDQKRYVEGAEEYIKESLNWVGISIDEGPDNPGEFGPYRQSERKDLYKSYVDQLLENNFAYYAFDTPEELDEMREKLKAAGVDLPQYNSITRTTMKNSLTLRPEEVKQKIENGEPYVIRLKVPRKEEVRLNDSIRGWVMVHSSAIDDKVLMKSDGMPTYHLANVVDDHLMKITHVIRGEEWLPSAPLHILLYRYLGWEDSMPQFAHLPLILSPSGTGKLSKRHGDKLGFPVFPIDGEFKTPDGKDNSVTGFREAGFLPEAVINFLAFLGWNPGTTQEVFTIEDLTKSFSLDRIGKAGTKFDIEKAGWFNQQHLREVKDENIIEYLKARINEEGIVFDDSKLTLLVELFKERATFMKDFFDQATFLFQRPGEYDEKAVSKKWNGECASVLSELATSLNGKEVTGEELKHEMSSIAERNDVKPGKMFPALRLAVTGQGMGPDLQAILDILGSKEVVQRIEIAIDALKDNVNV